MTIFIRSISLIGVLFAFSHSVAAESLYASNVQSRLTDADRDAALLMPATFALTHQKMQQ